MSDNIKVVVKVRPLVKRESDEGLVALWSTDSERIWPTSCTRDSYTFDSVFGETCTTQDVYEEVARPIVEAALNGINGTIFAYGQTSSGKTYTMMGTPESPGIIPLAVSHIFDMIKMNTDRNYLLRVSFIEIYNEKMKDLLDIKSSSELKIQEKDGCWQVTNCREVVTNTPEEIIETFEKGNVNRSVGETLMNDKSSRSHTIFKIIMESRKHVNYSEEEDDCVIFSQLNLVDLAGSERASQTGATKERLREGGHINKSLVTLSRVIRQLSDVQGDPNRYINYRDSKLTHILQSSLGGNAKTGIICAVTPATLEETHSTLKFAMCAKVIANKPIVNAVVSDARQHKLLKEKLDELQKELDTKKLVEEDNVRLLEQISILNARIKIGFGTQASTVSNNNKFRRRTWCAPPNLRSISEDDDTPMSFGDKETFGRTGKNTFMNRLSSLSELSNDSSCRYSIASNGDTSPIPNTNCLTSLDSPEKNGSANSCSPNHKCFQASKTPPCVLRQRAKYAQKELDELEELTTLEKIYKPEEIEYMNRYNTLQENFTAFVEENNKKIKDYDEQISILKNKVESYSSSEIQLQKLKAQVIQLTQENTDFEFQLKNIKNIHQAREKDLLFLIDEAKHDKKVIDVNDVIISRNVRHSTIPINLNDKSILDDDILTERDLELFMKIEQFCEIEYKNKALIEEIEDLNFELKEKIELIDIMEKSSIHYEKNYLDQVALISELRSEINVLKSNSVTLNEKLVNLQCENLKIPQLIADNQVLTEKLKLYQNSLEASTDKVIDSEHDSPVKGKSMIDLENSYLSKVNIQKENSEIAQLKDVIDKLNNIISDLKEDNEKALTYAAEKDSIITKLKNMSQNQENKILELICENKNLSSLNTEENIERVKSIENENLNLNKLLSDSKSEIERNLISIEELNQILSSKSQEILDIQCEIDGLISKDKENISLIGNFKNECENKNFLIQQLEESNEGLRIENEHLKDQMENSLAEIKELLLDTEDLQARIINQGRTQQVMEAEYSLLMSKLAAIQRHHSSLHGSCDSTLNYIKRELTTLQSCLKNNPNVSYNLNSTYGSLFTSMLADQDITVIGEMDETLNVTVDMSINNQTNYEDEPSLYKEESMIVDEVIPVNVKNYVDKSINCTSLNLTVDDKESEIVSLKTKCDELYKNLQDECSEKSNLKSTVDELSLKLQKRDVECETINKEIKHLKARISELEQENDTLSNQLIEYVQELEDEQKNKPTPERKSCINVSMNTTLSPIDNKDVSIVCDILSEDTSNVEHRNKINKLQSEIFDNQILIQSLEDKVASLTEEIKNQDETKNQLDIKIQELEKVITTHKLTEVNYNKEIEALKVEKSSLEVLVEDYKIKNNELDNTAMELRKKSESLSIMEVELRSVLDIKRGEIDDLNSEIERLNSELEHITNVENEVRNKLEIADELSNEHGNKIINLENEIKIKDNELDVKDKQINSLKEQCDNIQAELNTVSSQRTSSDSQLKAFVDEIDTLKQNIFEKTSERDVIANECKHLRDMNEESKSKLATFEEEVQSLRRQLDVHKEEAVRQNENVVMYKESYLKLGQDLIDLWRSVSPHRNDDDADMVSILQELKYEFADMQKNVDDMKRQLVEVSTELKSGKITNEGFQTRLNEADAKLKILKDENASLHSSLNKIVDIFKCDSNVVVNLLDLENVTSFFESKKSHLDDLVGKVNSIEDQISNVTAELSKANALYETISNEKSIILQELETNKAHYHDLISKNKLLERGMSNIFLKIHSIADNPKSFTDFKIDYDTVAKDDFEIIGMIDNIKNYLIQIKSEHQHLKECLRAQTDHCVSLKKQSEELEEQLKEAKSETKICGYMDFFVDKPSHDAVLDKNKDLQKSNEELRKKTRELMSEIRRLQHSVQNNTMNNMLPNDKTEIPRLKGRINMLEKELETMQTLERAYKKLKSEFKSVNEELGNCLKELKERDVEYHKQLKEKRNLEDLIGEQRIQLTNYKISEKNKMLTDSAPQDEKHVESLKATIENMEKDYKSLLAKYEEVDEECEMCAKLLREKESDYKTLYTEKKVLETRVGDLEVELKEIRDNSQYQERKKRRQSLLDMNRGCVIPSNSSSDDHNSSFERLISDKRTQELECQNKSLQKNVQDLSGEIKQLQEKLSALAKTASMSSQANIENKTSGKLQEINRNIEQAANPAFGSGALLNQRLSEYMVENQRLKSINSRLKELCRTRDNRIVELERMCPDKEN